MWTVGVVLFFEKVAAHHGGDAEGGEEVRRDAGGEGELGFVAAGFDGEAVTAVAGEGLESLGGALPVEKVWIRGRDTIDDGMLVAGFAEEEEFAGMVVRQRTKKGGIDDREDGGVGADAQGEGQDDPR